MSGWDDEDFEVEALGTAGEKVLADEKAKQFEGEDEEEEEDWQKYAKRQEPVRAEKKTYEDKGAVVDEPLDDPELEKLRQARLTEEADFQNTIDAFGDVVAAKLEKFVPKSEKDFEELASLLITRYIDPYKKSKHFKSYLKCLAKQSVEGLESQEVKDVESSLASVRVQKAKQEKAEKENAAKKGKKATLNVGRSATAGLDDLIYEDDGDEEYDFM